MCYAGPTLGAVISTAAWLKTKNIHHGWLTLLFWGAAIFGLIDHALNGELLALGPNRYRDLMNGGVMTAGVIAAWGLLVWADKLGWIGKAVRE